MTDSEDEFPNSNVFTFQNVNTTVSVRGPYTNISNFSFRNQSTSTMYNMPRNFERQRYAKSVSDQRSIYYRRERSPVSIHSAYDIRPRNFQQPYYGMRTQQSIYNGRSGSPSGSIRSIDSSASAADIAFAFKNVKFSKYDLKVIKEAYRKLMKQCNRKRIYKRRNRNRLGYDSGEQASDSSISSDDCRSVKTSYKENMSSSKTIRMDNMVKDCTESFRQNPFKNIFSVATTNLKGNQNSINSSLSNVSALPSLKERFKSGFALPSERFNKSIASTVNNYKNDESNYYKQNDRHIENTKSISGSEDEIFPGMTNREKIFCNTGSAVHKRSLESDEDSSFPDRKRSKKSSPNIIFKSKTKILSKTKNSTINDNVDTSNNFEFVKPTLPVRKSRSKQQEKLLAKSKQPLTDCEELTDSSHSQAILEKVETVQPLDKPSIINSQIEQSELSHDCNVSMRPSFIKRKLFTQKLDVAEKTNLSSDGINSPQNLYSAFQKEKNKTRKLVPTQSCMNREVQSDNNLIDLIHKIVPPDCINKSNQTSLIQKTDVNNKGGDDDDTWDVTSVISMYNENDGSETFTDEEIFDVDDKKKNKSKNINNNSKHRPRTRNNSSIKPETTKTIDENINVSQERRTANKIRKEEMKTMNNNSHPKTRNNSIMKSKPTKSVEDNVNQASKIHNYSTNKENTKKTNNTNPHRTTRNNRNSKSKATKSIDENKNPVQNKEKSKKDNLNNCLKTCNNISMEPKVLVNKIPESLSGALKRGTIQKTNSMQTNTTKNMVKNSAKTFWDTDFESDAEYQSTPQRKHVKEIQSTANKVIEAAKKEFKHPASRSTLSRKEKEVAESSKCLNITKNTFMNNSIDSNQKFNISTLSLRSHRTSTKKRSALMK